jgi:peptidoglycan/xylan/chitin deacetylase (PgdA/CDA1 family)
MIDGKKSIIRSGLEALYFSRAYALMQPFVGGVGAILTLHRVQPESRDKFRPNQHVEITPEFLELVIRRLERSGIDLVSLDEMHNRLTNAKFSRRFLSLTFDDGYRDTKEWAYPILKSHGVPFAIYVPTSFPERFGELWWVALELIIANNETVVLEMDRKTHRLNCRTLSEKYGAYRAIYRWLRSRRSETELREIVRDLAIRYEIDMAEICSALTMTWDEITELAADPLVTFGTHSVSHSILAATPEAEVRSELRTARTVLEAALGREALHLAYPYGDASAAGPREFQIAAELGYKTAVTTKPSVLFPEHAGALTCLPRISLNGEFQRERYVDVLISGAGTALWNRLPRSDAPVRDFASLIGAVKCCSR